MKRLRFSQRISSGSSSKTVAWGTFLAICLILFTPISGQAEPSKELPSATLIYDLSNSMWAPIKGTPKITHAQSGIATGLTNYHKKLNLGLIVFGHTEKTGCDNVQELMPLDVLNRIKTISKIKPLRPRGNAPIGKSLLDAANMPSNRADPFTIILLSDGASNCPIDPCKTAQSLKGAFKNLVIDVVALGSKKSEDLKSLSCISNPSGGKLTFVNSAQGIGAAIEASLKRSKARLISFQKTKNIASNNTLDDPKLKKDQLAANTKTDNQDGWAGATEIIVTPKQKEVTGALDKNQEEKKSDPFSTIKAAKTQGGLALVAHLVDKGAMIKNGLIWRIYNEKPDKITGKHKLISVFKTASPVMSLPKGSYLINAAYGRAFLTKKVEITAGKNKTEQFILNAGGLKIASVLANGSPVPENSVYYDILSDERDQFGKRIKVITKVRPGLVVRLNAGIYHIISTYGDANAQSRADVSVEAGKLTEAIIDHKAAKVTFKLVYQKGGEALADTKWSLLTSAGKVIKKSAGAVPTHFLAAGDYTILAERGDKKYSQDFSIQSGDSEQIEVIIQ